VTPESYIRPELKLIVALPASAAIAVAMYRVPPRRIRAASAFQLLRGVFFRQTGMLGYRNSRYTAILRTRQNTDDTELAIRIPRDR